ncbi:hypothetical protein [Bacillus mycoides]|uniref:hypothetical protein n=1 Tax=Bacillus mycoides TaxID=1405 RepID=UPI0014957820|nr:hypothetical protein [Bacillus mycoides]
MNDKFVIVLAILICLIFYFGVDYLLSLNTPIAIGIAGLVILFWFVVMVLTRKK